MPRPPLSLLLASLAPLMLSASLETSVLPQPQTLEAREGAFPLDLTFRVEVAAPPDSRAFDGGTRFLQRLRDRTGLFLPQGFVRPGDTLTGAGLRVEAPRVGRLEPGEDESYTLTIGAEGIVLAAPTDLGALHGLETLLQLLDADRQGYHFPALHLADAPRFPWRGLLLDVARHFMPVEVIKRNLDGMAAVKMNVLHWHLTEDQGFRIESKTFPRLHELGSDGFYYTHEQVREIIAYADARGIRVYPEFDIPGHATSWLVGHPELGSLPGPYEIERKWGIFDPALDPSKEEVYTFLEAFFTEMAALFPDPYIHIGGDEVTGKHWAASPRIQNFMREKGIADQHELQAFFNRRVLAILTRLDKRMIGWDEIFLPSMPTDIVIHSWRGREAMEEAARQGYQSILSNGYYIDLMQPAEFHYLNDPLPPGHTLSPEEAARVLGGEATMWSEHVTPETVDSRIWPRTAAIAERLWSSSDVRDVETLHARLDRIALQLEEHGLTHLKNRPMLMRRLVRGPVIEPLALLADVVEPLKIYQRNADDRYTQFSPYTLLPDIAIADAPDARAFRRLVTLYQENGDEARREELKWWLKRWKRNHRAFRELAREAPALREALPLSAALRDLADLGLDSLEGVEADEAWWQRADAILARAREPVAKVELQVVDAVEALLPDRP
jgi:hexosaminidase